MQSAIGIVQLKRVTKWSEIRQRNAIILLSNLKEFTGKSGILKIPKFQCIGCEGLCTVNGCRHAWYRCYIEVLPERLAQGRSTSDIVMALQKKGVPCNHGTCSELYLEKAFENTQFKPRQPLPVAQYLGERSISFATHPTIGQKTMTEIAQTTAEVIRSFKLN